MDSKLQHIEKIQEFLKASYQLKLQACYKNKIQ